MSDSMWVEGIDGDFAIHKSILEALPKGTKIASAEPWGLSAWSTTGKISVILPDGSKNRYFIKHGPGKIAMSSMWGEYASAVALNEVCPGFVPKAVGKGDYHDEVGNHIYFYIQQFHNMDIHSPPDPQGLVTMLAELHSRGKSPNGMFGFHVPTGGGLLVRTVKWEKSWATQFTHQFKDVVKLDNAVNPPWPEYDAACKQIIDHVIPRLLGALQSDGREIEPTLVHLDLWEGNVGTDKETGKIIAYDPGCSYAHNEVEFGTWRCRWATHFRSPIYQELYQREYEPSKPVEEWDDRNRIYAIRASLCDSAGHPGSSSRQIAYNDMLFLCEKYAPFDHPDKYDPEKDISVTGIKEAYDVMRGVKMAQDDSSIRGEGYREPPHQSTNTEIDLAVSKFPISESAN